MNQNYVIKTIIIIGVLTIMGILSKIFHAENENKVNIVYKEEIKISQHIGIISDIVINNNGDILIADSKNHTITQISPDGKLLMKIGHMGNGPGEFDWLRKIAVDLENNIYAIDGGLYRVIVFDKYGFFKHSFQLKNRPAEITVNNKKEIFVYYDNPSNEKVYLVDMFTFKGEYLLSFGKKLKLPKVRDYYTLKRTALSWVDMIYNRLSLAIGNDNKVIITYLGKYLIQIYDNNYSIQSKINRKLPYKPQFKPTIFTDITGNSFFSIGDYVCTDISASNKFIVVAIGGGFTRSELNPEPPPNQIHLIDIYDNEGVFLHSKTISELPFSYFGYLLSLTSNNILYIAENGGVNLYRYVIE